MIPPDDIVERMYWTTIHGDQEQAVAALEAGAQEIVRLRAEIAERPTYVERVRVALANARRDGND